MSNRRPKEQPESGHMTAALHFLIVISPFYTFGGRRKPLFDNFFSTIKFFFFFLTTVCTVTTGVVRKPRFRRTLVIAKQQNPFTTLVSIELRVVEDLFRGIFIMKSQKIARKAMSTINMFLGGLLATAYLSRA